MIEENNNNYTEIVNKTFQKAKYYSEKTKFDLIIDGEQTNVQLFCNNKNVYKTEAILNVSVSLFYKFQSDVYENRIYLWDTYARFGLGKLIYMKVLETFEVNDGQMFYIEFIIKPDSFLYEPRYFQGIHWSRKNKVSLFKTCKHLKYEPKENNCQLFYVSWFNEIEQSQTFVTELIKFNFGGKLKKIDVDTLRNRLNFLESACKNFEKVYDPFKCSGCHKNVQSHLLKCLSCHVERYGKCNDLSCNEPCHFDDETCKKCGQPITKINF